MINEKYECWWWAPLRVSIESFRDTNNISAGTKKTSLKEHKNPKPNFKMQFGGLKKVFWILGNGMIV